MEKFYKLKIVIMFGIYLSLLGFIVGGIAWLFLNVSYLCRFLLWDLLQGMIQFEYYASVTILIGGILIGYIQTKYPRYPRLAHEIGDEFKSTRRISYDVVHIAFIAALLPLVFAGSLGPEAALVGVIGGMSTWMGDKLRHFYNNIDYLTDNNTFRGFKFLFRGKLTIESRTFNRTPSRVSKTTMYTLATFSSTVAFLLLNSFRSAGLYSFDFVKSNISMREWLFLIPLIVIGIVMAVIYEKIEKVIVWIIKPISDKRMILAVMTAVVLASTALVLPYTLFSGITELQDILLKWEEMSILTLTIIGIWKLFLTALCLKTGWRGGHIFPLTFSGVIIGFVFSIVFSLEATITATVITTALLAYNMKRPAVAAAIVLYFFPWNSIPMVITTFVIFSILGMIIRKNPQRNEEQSYEN